MRYIKTFESHDDEDYENEKIFRKELQIFCDGYLAYIFDDGFSVSLTEKNHKYEYRVRLMKLVKARTASLYEKAEFDWNDIKEDFIPFLEMLNTSYNIDSYGSDIEVTFIENLQHNEYNLEKIESDDFKSFKLSEIYINIRGKNDEIY